MGIIKPIIISFLSILILAWLLPASVSYMGIPTLIVASVVLTLLQKLVKPVLSILFLPFNIITLGLFSWVINFLIFWLAIMLVPGFHIDPVRLFGIHFGAIMSFILVSFLLSLIQSVIEFVF